jgi:penicillin V acylase-like amidase (Ntn superfamily)
LDNFATVAEAVAELKKDAFRVVPTEAPNGARGTTHPSISDASGDSAILAGYMTHVCCDTTAREAVHLG